MIQNAASLSNPVRRIDSCFIRVKMTDMEISEMGKEKPRKKVSSFSLSNIRTAMTTRTPAMSPMRAADPTLTKAQPAVIATRPARAPVATSILGW